MILDHFFDWGTQVEALVVGGLHVIHVVAGPGEAINLRVVLLMIRLLYKGVIQ